MAGKPALSTADECEAMGYLCNPETGLRYDVQVPPSKHEEFESDYRQWTGRSPCPPGTGGYSVLGEGVDKRSVQYRVSYIPAGHVPRGLADVSKAMSGNKTRRRVSNKALLIAMFRGGFLMGELPSRAGMLARIDSNCRIHFEFGYSSALVHAQPLQLEEFLRGFSAVDEANQNPFSMFDEQAASQVHSVRAGRSAAFRNRVLQAYRHQCCVCAGSLVDLSGIFETEAAHIVPKKSAGSDDARNGLALCRKHHWSFDRGLFGVDGERCVIVPDAVLAIPQNASLAAFHGREINRPTRPEWAPHPRALDWHRAHVMSAG